MRDQVKTPIIVVAAILVIGVVVFFAMKAFNAGNLDQGQVEYTPGVPPWLEKDPNKQGPGTTPGGQPGQQPAGANGQPQQAPMQPGMPGPSAIGNK